jgi:foldase protein PrsA
MAPNRSSTQIPLIPIICVIVGGILIALLLSSFGGVDESKDVAEVDGAGSIAKQDFNHWLQVVASQPQPGQKKPPAPPKPGTKEYDAVKQQVMSFLISAKWIEGEAKDRGISASPEEVKRQFEQTKDQSFPNEKAYQRFLKTSAQNEQDLLYRVKLDVLSNKIREQVTRGTTDVSDADVKDYYDKNEQQFSQPERRDVEVVKTKTEAKANEALKRLENGDSFKKVAKAMSIDAVSKAQDGRLIGVSKGQQDPKFDAALFTAVKGKIAGPIKTDSGFYVFRVNKVTKATKQSLDQSKQGIRQLLVSQKQQQKLDNFSTTFRSDWRANTDCAKDYVIADCRNGREQQQPTPPVAPGKQPVKGSSGTAPPALDGTGQPLVGSTGGGPVIGTPTPSATAGLPGAAAPGGGQTLPLALGGAPKQGGTGALPPGIVPGGGAPGSATPPPGG